jgi:hypothetical protein
VYDHEQPAAGADVSAVVALAPRAWVGTAMIWRADCRHDLVAVGSQLSVLVEDVLPAFVIENHGASVRVDCFGKGTQGLSASWAGASGSGICSWVARTRRGYSRLKHTGLPEGCPGQESNLDLPLRRLARAAAGKAEFIGGY